MPSPNPNHQRHPAPASAIPTALPTAALLIDNMHCPSCVESISQLLADIPSVKNLSISLLHHRITFAVDSTPLKSAQNPVSFSQVVEDVKHILAAEGGYHASEEGESSSALNQPVLASSAGSWFGSRRLNAEEQLALERHARHLERCKLCRDKEGPAPLAPPTVSAVPPPDQVFNTTLSIEGMTCASCTKAITSGTESHPSVLSTEVALVSSSANIRHKASFPASELAELISDMGYEATVIESHPEGPPSGTTKHRDSSLVVTQLSIDGMTCSSCSAGITSTLNAHEGLFTEISIDVLGNKGVITHNASITSQEVADMVTDSGYDATVVSSQPLDQDPAGVAIAKRSDTRTVSVRVLGVFCNNCVDRLNHRLNDMPLEKFTPLTLKNPVTTVTFAPRKPLTIRDILRELADVAPEFDTEIVKSLSLSERSQAIQRREVKLLASHLVVAVLLAIPTFIIGIVSMALLPKHDAFRMYWMKPVWGGADRGTVALWPLATLAQFGVGHIFYKRTFNAMWPHLRGMIPAFLRPKSMSRLPSRPFGWRSLFSFGSMDLLVTLSTTVSYFASIAMLALDVRAKPGTETVGSYFDSSVFLMMFILLGRTLEAYAKSRTTDAVSLLGDLRPATAFLIEDSTDRKTGDLEEKHDAFSSPIHEIPVEAVEYGDLLLVHPGSLPPTDGIIASGTTTFDESSLTGESVPVQKGPGDEVFTGTTNQTSAVALRVTSLPSDTMLERIIRAVSDAGGKKAPLERAAERLTGIFVPIVVYISIMVLCLWLGLTFGGVIDSRHYHGSGGRAFFAIEFAIAVLVVACPCGIGLAVPCANAVGNGLMAAAGILASGGGEAFTAATQVTTIAFDKTGTLTVGKSVVTGHQLYPIDGLEEEALLGAIRDAEAGSTHPLAVGLVKHLDEQISGRAQSAKIVESTEIPGRGLRAVATVPGGTLELLIGNAALLSENDLPLLSGDAEMVRNWSSDAKSVILVGARVSQGDSLTAPGPFALAAAYALSDPLRPTTKAALSALKGLGYRLVMLSGDNELTARSVARAVGIDPENVHAGVKPEGKAEAIAALRKETHQKKRFLGLLRPKEIPTRVMFIGDGLNDAVALAAADCSAAMGHGSEATLATADFVLLSSDLQAIHRLLALSRKVQRRQWINLVWACIFNFTFLPIAAGVLFPANGFKLNPVWSAVLMALSSVSVVLSSLALRWGL